MRLLTLASRHTQASFAGENERARHVIINHAYSLALNETRRDKLADDKFLMISPLNILSDCPSIHIEILNIETLNIETLNIETLNIETLNIEILNIEILNIETFNIETFNIETLNILILNIETLNIETFNILILNTAR